MGLTKAQLEALNITSFPDNTTGLITPTVLRGYNTASIENTVNQDVYTTDSASFKTSINNLNAATSSYVTSAITASSLITASFDNGTRNLTFTKGNNAQFSVNIPDVSGSTGNFATTGSNTFNGNQTITGSVTISGSATNDLVIQGRALITTPTSSQTPQLEVSSSLGRSVLSRGGIFAIDSTGTNLELSTATAGGAYLALWNATGTEIGFNLSPSSSGYVTGWSGGPSIYVNDVPGNFPAAIGFQSAANYTDGTVTILKPLDVSGSLDIQNTLTASLQQGFTYVGNSAGRTTTVSTASFATTGSNTFRGTQTITGSVFISSSGGLGLSNTDGANVQYFGNSFGSNIGVYKVSDATEIGLALDGATWTTNWANGPIIYVNNTPGDTYEGVFGFQNKTNYTDGRITALKPLDVRGNTTITGSLTISSSAATDLAVIGNSVFTGNTTITGSTPSFTIRGTNGVTTQFPDSLSISSSLYRNLQGARSIEFLKSGFDYNTFLASYTTLSSSVLLNFTDNLTQTASYTVGVFDNAFTQDVEFAILTDVTNGIQLQDIRSDTGAYVTFLKIAPNGGSNPPLEFKRGMQVTGSVSIAPTHQVRFATGSNQQAGTAVLDGGNPGTVTVSNSLVTANSIIMLTKQTNNHPNAGPVNVSSKGAGTFTITSNHNGDADTVGYFIINNS